MADFDADGHADLITGCYEGGSYLLAGIAGGGFAAPHPVRDRSGAVLRVGRYYDDAKSSWSAVASSKFADCHGISATPMDWDGDGDLDLIIGTTEGRVFLRRNEGSPDTPAFATGSVAVKAGGEIMQLPSHPVTPADAEAKWAALMRRMRRDGTDSGAVPPDEPAPRRSQVPVVTGTLRDLTPGSGNGRHAMPAVADWDGDGKLDLISGGYDGAVYWFRNVGAKTPHFEAPEQLLAPGSGPDQPGRRVQVAVADHDGDGDADLLVGDYQSSYTASGARERHGYVWLVRRTTGRDGR